MVENILQVYFCSRTTYMSHTSMSPSILVFNFIQFKVFFFWFFFCFFGEKIGYFQGWDQIQLVLGFTHIVQHLLFSLFPSIMTFDSDLIFGLFLTFWVKWSIWGLGSGSKILLGSTPSILTFKFDLILGSFWLFGALMGNFCGWGRIQKLFWGLLIQTNNFCFLSFALFLLYHVVLSLCGGVWVWVGGWWYSQRLISLNPTTVMVVLLLGLFCCWAVTILL